MAEKPANQYRPDVVSSPGETLAEVLEDRGMSQAELADRMGRPKKTINEIINAKSEITPETALQLERVLTVPASFWSGLERNYRDYLAREREQEQLLEHADWPSQFPMRQMEQLGWATWPKGKADRVRALLSYFAVSSIPQWQQRYKGALTAFRLAQKFKPSPYALSAWLREGERRANAIHCTSFDSETFRVALREARDLTREGDPERFQPRLKNLGRASGVAIVFVPELVGTRACGATRWLSPTKALIQLGLRYKSNDQLWFTFFHEAGHILLHGKRDAFVDVWGRSTGSRVHEDEANRFSADLLIPEERLQVFLGESESCTEGAILTFAKHIGVAPGIVVGRLQHDNHLDYGQFNYLKLWYQWTHED